jgi:hypothetical protein
MTMESLSVNGNREPSENITEREVSAISAESISTTLDLKR